MVQEKYNKLIFDSADEESLRRYSHLRLNALSVIDFTKEDKVLLIGESSEAIVEGLSEMAGLVARDAASSNVLFDYIISFEPMDSTPATLAEKLVDGGIFVYVGSKKTMSEKFVLSLVKESNYELVSSYKLWPNYLYTTEIFANMSYQENFSHVPVAPKDCDYLVISRKKKQNSMSAQETEVGARTVSSQETEAGAKTVFSKETATVAKTVSSKFEGTSFSKRNKDLIIYRKLSNERSPKYSVITDIVSRSGHLVVLKRPAGESAQEHINRVMDSYEGLKSTFEGSVFGVNKSELVDGVIESEFLSGKQLTKESAVDFIENIKKTYMSKAQTFTMTEGFKEVFGDVTIPVGVLAAKYIDIDLIFENLIVQDEKWNVIDFEWCFDFPIPINYIFYRAKKFSDLPPHLYDISAEEVEAYEQMEEHFQSKYAFEGVYNLHEIEKKIKGQNRGNQDFTIASRDYQIKQLKQQIVEKDVHIRNITSERDDFERKYNQIVSTKGYQMLEGWRSFKSIFTGEVNPRREAKKQAKQLAKTTKVEAKQKAKALAKEQKANKKPAPAANGKKQKGQPTIAIHAHIFYVDLISEFASYFENMPFKFDLYLSVQEGTDEKAIRTVLKPIKQIQTLDIRALPNRGRDIAPLYCKFAPEILKHDYFLHIHTKKSLYSGVEKGQWRKYCLEVLLGSSKQINYIFDLFENKNAGLVYPDIQEEIPMIAYSWLANEAQGRALLKEYGITDVPEVFNYPAGSFFWARTDALRPLLEHGYTYEDFPREQGQTDGTLAHTLERVIPFISRKQGYDDYILYLNEEDTCKNTSLRPFSKLFKMDKQLLTMKLGAYDVVSFDIFDTLIARTIAAPNDLYKVMGEMIKEKYQIDCDFLKIRKAAEVAVAKSQGAYGTIDHIYQVISENELIGEYAMALKQLEIDLEFKLCVPRKEMVEVFNALKTMDCKVILTSDMYLTKVNIVAMLHKCGITGYDELFLSCECGGRKDDGSLWDIVFSMYSPEKFIHVGDNFRSDSQILMDRGVDSFAILNGKAMLEISPFKHLLESDFDKNRIDYKNSSCLSGADSLILGNAINGGIFNSPFAYNAQGQVQFRDAYDFGYTTLGPLLTYFAQWIIKENADTNKRLLLLAREGYMLEKILKCFTNAKDVKGLDSKYFLCSRRAVSVPAIADDEDLEELLSQKYEGSFSNLLQERLGLTKHEGDVEYQIDYSFDIKRLMELVTPYKDELFANAAKEKNAYMNYIKEQIGDATDVAVVDVGFAGTIQYFLMKLTGRDIGGYYLGLHSNKPSKIGGKCEAVFEIKDASKIAESKLMRYQLFLENALSAPFGQLLNFEMRDGKCVPLYKNDSAVNSVVEKLQQGICDYAAAAGASQKGASSNFIGSSALVENIFYDIIASGALTEEIASQLTVEDGYSKGGVQRFDVASKSWKVE